MIVRSKFKRSVLLAFMMLFMAGQILAQPIEKSKKINKSYQVKEDVRLEIDNRFGKVHINSWDKKEISVQVIVVVKKKSGTKAQELLDNIEIDIDGSPRDGVISFKTQMSGNTNTRDDEEFSIDYIVNMPSANPLDVKNHYGELYVADRSGINEIDVAYGNFRIENVLGESTIQLAYGNGELESMLSGQLDVSYSNLTAEKLGNIEIDSRYSKIRAGELGEIVLEDRYGSLKAKKAISIDGEIKYAGLEIAYLVEALDLQVQYGKGIEIESVSKDFDTIEIDARYTSITINFEKGAAFEFEGSFSYCGLKYEEEDFDFKYANRGNTSSEYQGSFGVNPKSEVSIESSYGNVRIGWSK